MFSHTFFSRSTHALRTRQITLLLALLASLSLVACADDDASTDTEEVSTALEIIGTYANGFGGTETITEATWKTESDGFPTILAKIDSFDNGENVAITQNPSDAEFSPDAFNKIVWTEPDTSGEFYYCTVAFGLASAEEAAASEDVSDASDPASGGCTGFSWTVMTPQG